MENAINATLDDLKNRSNQISNDMPPVHNVTLDRNSELLKSIANYLLQIFYWIFITIGVSFNMIAFAFFVQRIRQQVRPADLYLASLALFDGIGVMGASLLGLPLTFKEPINFHRLSGCNLFPFLLFVPFGVSALLIVSITIDRFVALYFPFTFRQNQSTKRVCVIIIAEIIFELAINFHSFGGMKPSDIDADNDKVTYLQCDGKSTLIDWYVFNLFPLLDVAVYFFIPSAILLIFNLLIIIKVTRIKSNPEHQTKSPEKLGQSSKIITKHAERLTKLCLVLSFSFMILIGPQVFWRFIVFSGAVKTMNLDLNRLISNLLNILV